MKIKLRRLLVLAIKMLGVNHLYFKVPNKFQTTSEWFARNSSAKSKIVPIFDKESIEEVPPIVVNSQVSKRFSKYFKRLTNEAFVAIIENGKVFGDFTNMIIGPDNIVISDLSREFGAEGGRKPVDFSIFHNLLYMPKIRRLKGRIAVISTCGSNNFHHWNYDVLPRFYLLKQASLLDQIDFYLVNYSGLHFQNEGLRKMGIDVKKIINPRGLNRFYVSAESLLVPSLPEDLGTISPWVLHFLRDTFLVESLKNLNTFTKIFVSRQAVKSRRIINEIEIMNLLNKKGYVDLVPEKYSMEQTAYIFSKAKSIVSVHGSGLSNLAFISEGTKVLDILAPFHQDCYYWMITNLRKSKYVAFFAEGEHPPDDLDLVKKKIDNDLFIDINKLLLALEQID